ATACPGSCSHSRRSAPRTRRRVEPMSCAPSTRICAAAARTCASSRPPARRWRRAKADRAVLGALAGNSDLDQWLTRRDGRVVVRWGKAELGQGIRTALVAVAADELGVDPALVDVEGPATGSSPNELITAGSGSIEQSATAVRQACAHARAALLARAAEELGVHADELSCEGGSVRATDGRHRSYWDLVGTAGLRGPIHGGAPARPP